MNKPEKNSVLVVDDENSMIIALTHILSADYTVYAAKNAQSAISAAEKYLPDVILLDVIMPDTDGYAVISALKASERTKNIPVIFITGLRDADDEEKGFALGASDYITKPFSPSIVKLRVNNQIKIINQTRMIIENEVELQSVRVLEQSKVMLDAIPTICCVLINSNYEVIDCNTEAVRLFDFDEKQEFLDRYFELSPKYQPNGRESYDLIIEYMTTAFNEGRCYFEWTHEKPGGVLVPCEVTLIRVAYHDELIIAGYTRDLRELKAAAENVHETEERLQLMLNAMPITCQLISQSYEIIDCNKEALDLFGLESKDEYIEKYNDFLPEFQPNGRPSHELEYEYIDSAFIVGSMHYEWMYQKPDGEQLPCEVTLVRAMYQGAYIIAKYARDLREQRAMYEEMRRAEVAEESSKEKSKFLAMISHEIRTPMNAIIGITEIQLQDDEIDPKYEDAFNKIYTSSDLLLGLINNLLDMSKIDANKLELVPVKYETASLISDVVNINLVRFHSKPLEFKLRVDENIPASLIGDDLRIKQILNNLISNAFKYTKTGSIEFIASAEHGDVNDSGATLVFTINDTGIGMSKDQVSKLFEEYSRFNMEANRVTEGTGLGMHITRSLLHMMNGKIGIESELGKGTSITIRIWQGGVNAEAIGRELADNLENFQNNTYSNSKRNRIAYEPMPYGSVLIVDDVEMNLYVAKGLLAPYKLSIETAVSGFEAIEYVKSGRKYDVILMDHMMPEMDGIEAVQIIRGLGYDAPIVALTANAMSGYAEMFISNGFDSFLSKPIDMRQMDAVMRTYIRDKYPLEAQKAASEQSQTALPARDDVKPSYISALEGITEINTEIGLARVSGMAEMYYETLSMFRKRLIKECDALSDFLSGNDIGGFAIAVHGLKSQLSTIGAMELSETAQQLETAAKEKASDYCAEHFPAFREKLLALQMRMAGIFEDNASVSEKQDGDHAYMAEQTQKAIKAAEEFDDDLAVELIEELVTYDFGDEANTLLENALSAIKDFDFDTAIELLRNIVPPSSDP